MTKGRQPATIAIQIVLIVLAVLLASYVAGYFFLGERSEWFLSRHPDVAAAIERRYPNKVLAVIFRPAGKVESLFFRIDVKITFTPD